MGQEMFVLDTSSVSSHIESNRAIVLCKVLLGLISH